ncbi:hypothetical protein GEMRC1_000963 [Eukaryota sp. GEM-RC1]
MNWFAEAWAGVTDVTIRNCWEKVGIWKFGPQRITEIAPVDEDIEELNNEIQVLDLDDCIAAIDYSSPAFEREGGIEMTDEEIVIAMKVRWGIDDPEEEADSDVELGELTVSSDHEDISSQDARAYIAKVERFVRRHPNRQDILAPLKRCVKKHRIQCFRWFRSRTK